MTSPSQEYSTSHLAMTASNAATLSGVTTAIMRSCDSDMRISPGVSVESRSSTSVSSTRMPPSPLEASSEVAQEMPAAPRSWMPSTRESRNSSRQHSMSTFSEKGSPTCTEGRLAGLPSPSKDSEASTEAPPMPSPPVRAPKSTTLLPTPEAFARRRSSCLRTPTARALTRGLPW